MQVKPRLVTRAPSKSPSLAEMILCVSRVPLSVTQGCGLVAFLGWFSLIIRQMQVAPLPAWHDTIVLRIPFQSEREVEALKLQGRGSQRLSFSAQNKIQGLKSWTPWSLSLVVAFRAEVVSSSRLNEHVIVLSCMCNTTWPWLG